MRFFAMFVTVAAACSLAACGSEQSATISGEDGENVEYTINDEDGETSMTVATPDGNVTMRTGANVPVDLPGGFSLIPDAEVISNTVIDQGDTKGALLTFRSDKTPDSITEFYRAEAQAGGFDIQIETSMTGSRMIGGESKAKGMTFSVTATSDGEGTTGQLTISEDVG
ncbi:hypothetical protein EH31_04640 [Erythrobacter longus]|uniref:Uncharacterized protein n=1 Tax=Erythrobacter longus TaxID=1044 RepID=A0A074MGK9_ERYLO|nr:hypothetical protein [Erythrobacter longus]KEO91965.1 hypothetical protein EH31_04640 [Erythrobacter longus]